MTDIKWMGNHLEIEPPKRTKKLTATRFATVLGLNPWSTPFEIWCEVTRTYEKPFEDTKYTIAGKTIEPKQAQYLKDMYLIDDMVTPTDIWGADYFKKTRGDFFPDINIFGGMWDYLRVRNGYEPYTVFEMKTTKRAEDWADDIPEYYALQAALYAYLLGVDTVVMVCSILQDMDYAHPEKYECGVNNTFLRSFRVSDRYPDFEENYLKPAKEWWETYVKTGVSPDFDEKKDAEILKALRSTTLSPETDIEALIAEAEELKEKLEAVSQYVAEEEKRLKVVTALLKGYALSQFKDGVKKVTLQGKTYNWEITKTTSNKIDKTALERDGLLEKYTIPEETAKITTKLKKELKKE